MKKVEIMKETQRVHAVQLTILSELRSLRKQFDAQTEDFKMICKFARDDMEAVFKEVDELQQSMNSTANVLQRITESLDVVRTIVNRTDNVIPHVQNAIKELKNVNDGR